MIPIISLISEGSKTIKKYSSFRAILSRNMKYIQLKDEKFFQKLKSIPEFNGIVSYLNEVRETNPGNFFVEFLNNFHHISFLFSDEIISFINEILTGKNNLAVIDYHDRTLWIRTKSFFTEEKLSGKIVHYILENGSFFFLRTSVSCDSSFKDPGSLPLQFIELVMNPLKNLIHEIDISDLKNKIRHDSNVLESFSGEIMPLIKLVKLSNNIEGDFVSAFENLILKLENDYILECTFDIDKSENEYEIYGILSINDMVLGEIRGQEKFHELSGVHALRLVGYNIIDYDIPLLKSKFNIDFNNGYVDVVDLMWVYNIIYPLNSGSALDDACKKFQIDIEERHSARGDTRATLELWKNISNMLGFDRSSQGNFIDKLKSKNGHAYFFSSQNCNFMESSEKENRVIASDRSACFAALLQREEKVLCITSGAVEQIRIYGGVAAEHCIATGKDWQFYGFEGDFFIDLDDELFQDLPEYLKLYIEQLAELKVSNLSMISLPIFWAEEEGTYLGKLKYYLETSLRDSELKKDCDIIVADGSGKTDLSVLKKLCPGRAIVFTEYYNIENTIPLFFESRVSLEGVDLPENFNDREKHSTYLLHRELKDWLEEKGRDFDVFQNVLLDEKEVLEKVEETNSFYYIRSIHGENYLCSSPLFWQNDFNKLKGQVSSIYYFLGVSPKIGAFDYAHSFDRYVGFDGEPQGNVSPPQTRLEYVNVKLRYNFLNKISFYQFYFNTVLDLAKRYNRIVIVSFSQEQSNLLHSFLMQRKEKHENELPHFIYLDKGDRSFEKQIKYERRYIACIPFYRLSRLEQENIDMVFIPRIPLRLKFFSLLNIKKQLLLELIENDFFGVFENLNNSNSQLEDLVSDVLTLFSQKNGMLYFLDKISRFLSDNAIKNILFIREGSITPQSFQSDFYRTLEDLFQRGKTERGIEEIPQIISKEDCTKLFPLEGQNFTQKTYNEVFKKYWKIDGDYSFRKFTDGGAKFPFPDMKFKLNKDDPAIYQDDIINYIMRSFIDPMSKTQDSFIVAATGKGKSLLYQIPSIVLADDEDPEMTIIISPLIALMKDQVDELQGNGLADVITINSEMKSNTRSIVLRLVREGLYNIVYISPESFNSTQFSSQVLAQRPPALMVVDEAHCVSQWGNDFRIDYRKIPSQIEEIFGKRSFPIVALTATAKTGQYPEISVIDNIKDILKLDIPAKNAIISTTVRENLFYLAVQYEETNISAKPRLDEEKLNFIEKFLEDPQDYVDKGNSCLEKWGINERISLHRSENGYKTLIYCRAKATNEALALKLTEETGKKFKAFHAGLSNEEKDSIQEEFKKGKIDGVCATIAFGMGIDIPDIRLVIHYDLPLSVEAYYQEAGRAGRDNKDSLCILLYSKRGCRTLVNGKTECQSDYEASRNLAMKDRISVSDVAQVDRFLQGYDWLSSTLSQTAPDKKNGNQLLIPQDILDGSLAVSDNDGISAKALLYYLSKYNSSGPCLLDYSIVFADLPISITEKNPPKNGENDVCARFQKCQNSK